MELIVILGQTCSGKTQISIEVAKSLQKKGLETWIVGCDSRQVFKRLNIGTAKIEGIWETRKNSRNQDLKAFYYENIPHFLIDYLELDQIQSFNLASYLQDFQKVLTENQPDVVILTGGTGLFAKAIYDPNFQVEITKPNFQKQSQEIKTDYQQMNLQQLQTEFEVLNRANQTSINQSDFQNSRRLISKLTQNKIKKLGYTSLYSKIFFKKTHVFGLTRDQQKLSLTIQSKVIERVQNGFWEEFLELKNNGLETSDFFQLGLDYRLAEFFDRGFLGESEFLNFLIRENQRYAKRQLTWLKKEPLIWVESANEILDIVSEQDQTHMIHSW